MAGHAILRYQDSTSSLPIDRNITDGPTCYLFENIAETLDLNKEKDLQGTKTLPRSLNQCNH